MKQLARTFGPYLLIELLLPGGTLMAAGLYLIRNKAGRTVERAGRHSTTPEPILDR